MLKPHPAVLLNLAQSELRAGRHAEAAENFAKYIRQNPTAPAMEHARAAFEEARQKVAELNVEVTVPGATVSVDGADVARSPLPNVLYLMPGRHSIAARKGSGNANKTLDVLAGRRVYVTLELPNSYAAPNALEASGADAQGSAATLGQDAPASAEPPDAKRSKGFFAWIADSPAAIATVSVAGLALGTSAVLAGFASNRYAAANDAREQIMSALQDNVNTGVIGSSAVPCGEEGVANGVGNFNSLVPVERIDRLIGDYANACRLFSERSDSGDRLKTLSLVSLGVGAFATVGTIVWYFSDTGESSTDTAKTSPGAKRSATVLPLLSRDTQGVWLNLSF